jgi:hypothetical protein
MFLGIIAAFRLGRVISRTGATGAATDRKSGPPKAEGMKIAIRRRQPVFSIQPFSLEGSQNDRIFYS